MNINITRSQKAKANAQQKNLLQPIINYNNKVAQYGEIYAMLQSIEQLAKIGLIPKEEALHLFDSCYIATICKQIHDVLTLEKNKVNCKYEIDTSQLYIGMIVKNYQELCKLLNVEPVSGKQKQLQKEKFLMMCAKI